MPPGAHAPWCTCPGTHIPWCTCPWYTCPLVHMPLVHMSPPVHIPLVHMPPGAYAPGASCLLAYHALPEGMHFHGRLCEHAEVAAPCRHEVPQTVALNALLLPDLGTKVSGTDTIYDGKTLGDTTHHTGLSNLLSDLACCVARDDVGHYTYGAVAEAAKQSILEIIGRHRVRESLTAAKFIISDK